MDISQAILILTIIANVFLALTLIKAGLKRTLVKILTAYLIGVIGWGLFILINISMPEFTGRWEYLPGSLGFTFENLLFASSIIFISSIYWFAVYFVKNKLKFSIINMLILLFEILIFSLCLVNGVFYSKIIILPQGYALLAIKPLSLLFSIFAFSQMAAPLFILGIGYKKEKEYTKRRQLLILFIAYLLFFLVCLNTNWILPVYFNIFFLNSFGPTFSLLVVGGITYSVSRYRFLDIRSSMNRWAAYALLSAIFIGLYLFLLFAFEPILKENIDSTLVVAILTTLVGIFGVPPLQKLFNTITNKWFYKNPYNYAEALQTLSKTLNNNLNLEELLTEIEIKIKNIFKVDRIFIIIKERMIVFKEGHSNNLEHQLLPEALLGMFTKDNSIILHNELENKIIHNQEITQQEKTLKELGGDFEILVKIASSEKLTGFLGMSHKLSGDQYSQQDLQLLQTFAHQAAVAIEKSLLYDQLKQYAAVLEQKVKDRTSELENLQKSQSQVMIDISHSLQTPLTIMKSGLDSLKLQLQEDTQVKSLDKTVDEISKRIYDLLRLARLETQEEQFNFSKLDLSSLLRELAEYVSVMCEEKSINLSHEIQDEIYISGDRQRIEEMVNNLISNSIKHIANERTIKITLSARQTWAEIFVTDSGAGIASEFLPHVFERFYRGSGQNNLTTGMGVGLAITKKIVDNHRGNISVESNIGTGTTFFIKIPLYS